MVEESLPESEAIRLADIDLEEWRNEELPLPPAPESAWQ